MHPQLIEQKPFWQKDISACEILNVGLRSAYIASWLKALKNDKRFIFQAASHAQRAVDYLHGCQPMIDVEDEAAA